MIEPLDWGLLLDLIGISDDGKNSIITIPAHVLRGANRKLCTSFTARECASSTCGREVSRMICWKFLIEINPSSLQEAHKSWRLQCGMPSEKIELEWSNLGPRLEELQKQYYGTPDDEDMSQRMPPMT